MSKSKNSNASVFYKRSFKRVFFPTSLIILIFVIAQILIDFFTSDDIFGGIRGIVTGNFYNLWYMYMLAGLYFLSPYIIILRANITWNQYKFFAFVLSIWAIVSQATSKQHLAYSIGVCFAFLSYYLIGDILKTEITSGWKPSRKKLFLICMICVMISFLWRFTGHNYYISDAFTNFFSPTIFIYSICVFILFGTCNYNIPLNCCKLASFTFEIYLLHTFILRIINKVIDFITLKVNPLLMDLFLTIIVFLISLVLAVGFKYFCGKVFKLMTRVCTLNSDPGNF